MKPNKKNFCAGNFHDWLEIMLLEKCNATCPWCFERDGYKPVRHVDWITIANQAMRSGQPNVNLFGGEPTLYPDLKELIRYLVHNGRKVYLTTNGSRLTPQFVDVHMENITGINISIHDYSLKANEKVTGIRLTRPNLIATISRLHENGATVRLNCNLIKGYIDDEQSILAYIDFAKEIGATAVRFAELRNDPENFVNLYTIFGDKFGLNDEPFTLGCSGNGIINEMPVRFSQACGLHTSLRKAPENPEQVSETVLYYDGKFYEGWQKEDIMTEKELLELLFNIQSGDTTVIAAASRIMDNVPTSSVVYPSQPPGPIEEHRKPDKVTVTTARTTGTTSLGYVGEPGYNKACGY